MTPAAQPWIFSARFDGAFILAPAFIVTIGALIIQGSLAGGGTVSPLIWLALVVGVDVGHVYSTIFRTYLDRRELAERPLLYGMTPLFAWLGGCLLYSFGALVFWRVLAYAAVFHFVRQQYGLMMIYSRRERALPVWMRRLDKIAIYAATLYPLIYWHCYPRDFSWFVAGDFVAVGLPLVAIIAGIAYGAVILAYLAKEIWLSRRLGIVNLPRNLLMGGTALSWFVGIVWLNDDLTFTATNVIAHGVPYLALIWGYGHNQTLLQRAKTSLLAPWLTRLFSARAAPLFLVLLFGIAWLEEGFWDGLVWREHGPLFGAIFQSLPDLSSSGVLMWLVPLLAVPQATHYILDAFIWRLHGDPSRWKETLFFQTSSRTSTP